MLVVGRSVVRFGGGRFVGRLAGGSFVGRFVGHCLGREWDVSVGRFVGREWVPVGLM